MPNIKTNSPIPSTWNVSVGPETKSLLKHFDIPEESTLLSEARQILGKCAAPSAISDFRTGLVIGYVQSGKTMSFTTVTALARDNGYRMVIVITGTSVSLQKQSEGRLLIDLRLSSATANREDRNWRHLSNPKLVNKDDINEILEEWRDVTVPEVERQTIIITVMKQHSHLRNLAKVLSEVNLSDVPTLIIDDEADQAGLNNRVQEDEESTTYSLLLELRRNLPRHNFLQYTATPQAPLLISLIDTLSPQFVQILTPGPDYTGGKYFFIDNPKLIKTLAEEDIPTRTNILQNPPESLLEAMRFFFLGVASAYASNQARKNRSMMIHPSRDTLGHDKHFQWVEEIKDKWKNILGQTDSSPEKIQLIADFASTYEDLKSTATDVLPYSELQSKLLRAIRKTRLQKVNASRGATPQVSWNDRYAWILVGGQSMDRGFTVEGLTVTYMPRGRGVGNADTIQQRARFFGYKKKYIGYCRVFLENEVRIAFADYVEHEEDIRAKLMPHSESGAALAEWKRAFFLDRDLRPTRQKVLKHDYLQSTFSDSWFYPRAPHILADVAEENNRVISGFVNPLDFKEDTEHTAKTEEQKHQVVTVKLKDLYKNLLTQLRIIKPSDSQKYTGILLQTEAYLEVEPEAEATIYRMSKGQTRTRAVSDDGEITQLFQGPTPRGENRYPGDREIKKDNFTVQLHHLDLEDNDQEVATGVVLLAIWVPKEMERDWVSQHQPSI